MLDNLCKTRTHFSKWKCGKELGVDKHSSRRVESAHQILARWGVYRGFSTDRGVDHGEQCGRYLDHRDSTHEGRRDEARKVADLSLIHISEPTRLGMISYAVFCL